MTWMRRKQTFLGACLNVRVEAGSGLAGSLHPDPKKHPEAATVLRSNRHIVRSLKQGPDGQFQLFDDLKLFTLYPSSDRVRRVVVKNARGHAYDEIGRVLRGEPGDVAFVPLEPLTPEQRRAFEAAGTGGELAEWPEVGSRMIVQMFDEEAMVHGWVTLEPGRYRYSIDWSDGVTVKTVIWEYLATETRWEE